MKTKLKEYRMKFGLTQSELADLVKVRRETISLLEGGKYNPSLRLATRIATVFGTSTHELFEFEDHELVKAI